MQQQKTDFCAWCQLWFDEKKESNQIILVKSKVLTCNDFSHQITTFTMFRMTTVFTFTVDFSREIGLTVKIYTKLIKLHLIFVSRNISKWFNIMVFLPFQQPQRPEQPGANWLIGKNATALVACIPSLLQPLRFSLHCQRPMLAFVWPHSTNRTKSRQNQRQERGKKSDKVCLKLNN